MHIVYLVWLESWIKRTLNIVHYSVISVIGNDLIEAESQFVALARGTTFAQWSMWQPIAKLIQLIIFGLRTNCDVSNTKRQVCKGLKPKLKHFQPKWSE